jgi:small ligand-binding sensory domain FIST
VAARPLPWSRVHVLALWALLIAGGVVLFVGWWGTSGTSRLSRQVLWLNVAVVGVLVAGAGVVIWLATGRRAVGRRRLGLLHDPATVTELDAPAFTAHCRELVATVNMTRYHRADCSFVSGKAVRSASGAEHRRAGRQPCGMCLPEAAGEGGSR